MSTDSSGISDEATFEVSATLPTLECPLCRTEMQVAGGLAKCEQCGSGYQLQQDVLGALPTASIDQPGTFVANPPSQSSVPIPVPQTAEAPSVPRHVIVAGPWNCEAVVACDTCGRELVLLVVADEPVEHDVVTAWVNEYVAEHGWTVENEEQFCPPCCQKGLRR